MDARALADLIALSRRDAELAGEAARLHQLEATATRVRARAEAITAFFATYSTEELRLRAEVGHAEQDLERRLGELAAAEGELAAAAGDDERALAEKAAQRARDHVAVTESSLLRTRSALEKLEGDATELPNELTRLEAEANALSGGTTGLPSPGGTGPAALSMWASHVHAELFVALSQIATHRDRIVQEANQLASMLIGESTYGSTVAQALQQVEART